MTQLSVNVNKLATLRNARGKNLPDVCALALKILNYGAHGITVHPRPDGRHIRWDDVEKLSSIIQLWNQNHPRQVEFNIEGYPSPEFITFMQQIRPQQVTLVPDPPDVITSNAGWDLVTNEPILTEVLTALQPSGARVSLFVDPETFDNRQAQALMRLSPQRIELYTEAYALSFDGPEQQAVTNSYQRVAQLAHVQGIGINAGHDLNQKNLAFLLRNIPQIKEVSIGHALICEALEQGLESTVRAYLDILKPL